MSDKPATEYDKYLRIPELLALQKTDAELSCHDEMAFQIIHQVEELWMKLILHGIAQTEQQINADQIDLARASLQRIRDLIDLMSAQMRVLETLSPRSYFTIRSQLGRGSGQESPGFNRMLTEPVVLRHALNKLLERLKISLLDLHRDPEAHPALFALTEAMVDIDEGFQNFRYQHLALVRRIIGGRTPSLKGAPSELLEHGIKQSWYPELWLVREALFRDFMPGPSLMDEGGGFH